MPHFVAISWLVREQYEEAGYVMWTNGDVSGKKAAAIAAGFTVVLILLAPLGWWLGYAGVSWLVGGSFVGIVMLWLCFRFSAAGERKAAQQLFFYTLLYLPLALGLLAIGWKQG